ncbi:MAG TPA: transporter associated domain-containing protein, partial [Burkholderiaceae bacterium]|nr:transporter associated domain-containing protein [Burkholderiaceae bacterium]
EIEDEFDFDEDADHIVPIEAGPNGPRYRVRAIAEIGAFNERFNTRFPNDDFDTVGGLITEFFGRVPRRGDEAVLGGLRFEVLRADPRQVHLLMVEPQPPGDGSDAPTAQPD